MQHVVSLAAFFAGLLESVPVLPDVKPYIVHTLCRDTFDGVETGSIVLAQCAAVAFEDYRNIGDFVFWKSSFAQGYEFQDLAESAARLSYYRCYRMTGRQVVAYEVLADELPRLAQHIHVRMSCPLTTLRVADT